MFFVNSSNAVEGIAAYALSVGVVDQVIDLRYMDVQQGIGLLTPTRADESSPVFWIGASTIFGLLICSLSYVISTLQFKNATRILEAKPGSLHVPTLPHIVPFLFNAIELALNPSSFLDRVMDLYGCSNPLRVRAGPLNFCIVANRDHIQTLFRSSKALTSKSGTIFALSRILNTPKAVIPFYVADDSGMATKPRKGSTIRHEDRIHYWQAHTSQKWLSGASLQTMAEKYLSIFEEELAGLNINEEWVEIPDLYRFLQTHITTAAIKAMIGTAILEMYPGLVNDFWVFDRNVGNYSRLIPRWCIPEAYKVRDRLLRNIAKWTDYAHSMSDSSKTGQLDQDWEPYFGTKLMKAREHAYLQMPAMNLEARASETLGLLFASNGNAVPATFWYITEALKDRSLLNRLMTEAVSARGENGSFDLAKMATQPLLQSTYAEVLRLRIAITMIRSNEYESTTLGPYTIPGHTPMAIFSRLAALNRDAWAIRPRTLERPLDEFWAERFLVSSEESDQYAATNTPNAQSPSAPKETTSKFSLDGLAGCWIPFGGGQRMCPGRHFAKHEILGTFSVLLGNYDIEAVSMAEAAALQPDLNWAPYGGLPPAGKLRVRMRKRSSGY